MPDPFPLISEESTRRVRRIGVRISVFYFVALLAVLTGLAVLDGWETPATFAGRLLAAGASPVAIVRPFP